MKAQKETVPIKKKKSKKAHVTHAHILTKKKAEKAVSKIVHVTCTYPHEKYPFPPKIQFCIG